MLLSLLVLAGLQSQAQPSICDSLSIVGSQLNLTVEPIYDTLLYDIDYIWSSSLEENILEFDSCFWGSCILNIYNYNNTTGLSYDTLFFSIQYIDTLWNSYACTSPLIWNGISWTNSGPYGDQTQSPTGIENINPIYDNKIYDIMGRELLEIPSNMMYIKNYQLHIAK